MLKPSLKSIKDKSIIEYIEYLENQLKVYTESTCSQSYLNLKRIVDAGNQQLSTFEIDILTEEGQKKYKLVSKFVSDMQENTEQLEFFKSRMTPLEIASVEGVLIKKTVGQKVGMAEQMALGNKDGSKQQ